MTGFELAASVPDNMIGQSVLFETSALSLRDTTYHSRVRQLLNNLVNCHRQFNFIQKQGQGLTLAIEEIRVVQQCLNQNHMPSWNGLMPITHKRAARVVGLFILAYEADLVAEKWPLVRPMFQYHLCEFDSLISRYAGARKISPADLYCLFAFMGPI